MNNIDKKAKLNGLHNSMWAIEPKSIALVTKSVLSYGDDEDMEGQDNESNSVDIDAVQKIGNVAVIPITGCISKYSSFWLQIMGGTSTLSIQNYLTQAVSDSSVSAVILYIDSPGGSISGISDLAQQIKNCGKPVYAVISDMGCSAAYWIASQCTKIYANNTALVGSIGIYQIVPDTFEWYKQHGVTINVIKSSELKGAGVDGVPVDDKALGVFQTEVDDYYNVFKSTVSSNRKVKIDEVATGEAWIASKALSMGLIDAIGGLDDALNDISGNDKTMEINNQNSVAVSAVKAEAVAAAPEAAVIETAPVSAAAPIVAPEASRTPPEPILTAIPVIQAVPAIDAAKEARMDGYADAQKDEKARLTAILAVCGNRKEFALEQFLAGNDVGKATAAYAKLLEKELAATSSPKIGEGADPLIVVGNQPAADVTTSLFEADWNSNTNNCQSTTAGKTIEEKKKNYIEYRKYLFSNR